MAKSVRVHVSNIAKQFGFFMVSFLPSLGPTFGFLPHLENGPWAIEKFHPGRVRILFFSNIEGRLLEVLPGATMCGR